MGSVRLRMAAGGVAQSEPQTHLHDHRQFGVRSFQTRWRVQADILEMPRCACQPSCQMLFIVSSWTGPGHKFFHGLLELVQCTSRLQPSIATMHGRRSASHSLAVQLHQLQHH